MLEVGATMNQPFFQIKDIKKHFPLGKGLFNRTRSFVKAVDGVSFDIYNGETLSIVGESGCGKTTVAKMVLLLEEPTAGTIFWKDKNVLEFSGEDLKAYRESVQAVFQDPRSALQPRMKIGDIIGEPMEVNTSLKKREIRQVVEELLASVGLQKDHRQLYPHELSGGQQQRVAVARALSLNPSLIILDEPVSSVDVSIRAQILNMLKDIQKQFKLSYLFISHDLGTVRYMSHRVG
ncbi:ATP-binding cassette domain-containing protein, partial [Chloroflexota bacterium]